MGIENEHNTRSTSHMYTYDQFSVVLMLRGGPKTMSLLLNCVFKYYFFMTTYHSVCSSHSSWTYTHKFRCLEVCTNVKLPFAKIFPKHHFLLITGHWMPMICLANMVWWPQSAVLNNWLCNSSMNTAVNQRMFAGINPQKFCKRSRAYYKYR